MLWYTHKTQTQTLQTALTLKVQAIELRIVCSYNNFFLLFAKRTTTPNVTFYKLNTCSNTHEYSGLSSLVFQKRRTTKHATSNVLNQIL